MKLEFRHIAPYLPYDVKVEFELNYHSDYIPNEAKDYEYKGTCILHQVDFEWISEFKTFKPILRPLSDLTKEIEANGEKFVARQKIALIHDISGNNILHYRTGERIDILTLAYCQIDLLFKYHFDIFGLIPQGLAIDINTLES